MINTFLYPLYVSQAQRKAKLLAPYLASGTRVLDFGCGDGQMAQAITEYVSGLRMHGADVVDFGLEQKGVRFRKITAGKIPFPDHSFDAVISCNVLHHTSDPEHWLRECARVSRGAILLVEPVWRDSLELPFMNAWDWICNVWKSHEVPMQYAFASYDVWRQRLADQGFRLAKTSDIDLMPGVLPLGRSTLFIARKN